LGVNEDIASELQNNNTKCSDVNITDSGPITTIPGHNNVQGKLILYVTTEHLSRRQLAYI
jgi:hypothetical protein